MWHFGISVLLGVSIGACTSPADPPDNPDDPTPPPPPAIRILPLGNSITQADNEHLSYRYVLWTRLVDLGIEVDFVGSTREHFGGTPSYPSHAGRSFDPDHEGHWGWRADHILAGRGSGGLAQWLGLYDADIVLMHLGTNDVFAGQDEAETLDELTQIVMQLRSDNPEVAILWALLIPTEDADIAASIASLNTQAAAVARALDSSESPVRVVDLNQGFDAAAWTYDGVHPSLVGETWMAERWLTAIQAILP